MHVSLSLRNAQSLEEVAALLESAPYAEGMEGVEFSKDFLAGQYAWEAIEDSEFEWDEDLAEYHLDVLAAEYSDFDSGEALRLAKLLADVAKEV